MWLAEVAGSLIKSKRRRTHYDWLAQCVDTASSGLAATAAAAMGRLAIGDPSALASALDRVEREWRLLVLWGLARIDPALAERCEDFCVGEATNQGNQPMRPPVQSLRAEGAIALLRQTLAQHKTLAARIPLDNPRRRLAAPRRDRVQVQRQATFIRLISITESFCAVRLTEYVENVVDITAHSISSLIWETAAIDATGSWSRQKDAYKKWLGLSPNWKNVEGFIEARNAVAHGLGTLTRRQVDEGPNFGCRHRSCRQSNRSF